MKCKPWIRHFQPRKFQCFSSQFALHGLRALENWWLDRSHKSTLVARMASGLKNVGSFTTFQTFLLPFTCSPKAICRSEEICRIISRYIPLGGWLKLMRSSNSRLVLSCSFGNLARFGNHGLELRCPRGLLKRALCQKRVILVSFQSHLPPEVSKAVKKVGFLLF